MKEKQDKPLFDSKVSNFNTYKVQKPTTLLPFIMDTMQGVSRSKAKAILQGGGIRVNKMICSQFDQPLQAGDTVEISKSKKSTPLQSKYIKLLYEDKHIMVIEKSVGILSMPTPHHQFSVKSLLDEYLERSHRHQTAHVVHRLDRDTSGLMVYAKTMEAERILEDNWHNIVTDRRYVALVQGRVSQQYGTIESWLTDNKAFFTYSSPVDNGGKFAVTHYHVLKSSDDFSLVELKLETGRKNQIRVHMMDLGNPICGDPKYGNAPDPAGRLCLHAYRLFFYHPITRELMKFETPVPKKFLSVF